MDWGTQEELVQSGPHGEGMCSQPRSMQTCVKGIKTTGLFLLYQTIVVIHIDKDTISITVATISTATNGKKSSLMLTLRSENLADVLTECFSLQHALVFTFHPDED